MKFDAIVVLGAGFKGKQQHPVATISLDLARKLYIRGVAPKIIVSGGFNPKVKITEANVMKKHLVSNGVKSEDVIKEEKSRDTIGNAIFTKMLILKPKKWRKILVITSSYHMKRTKYIFDKVLGGRYKIKYMATNPGRHRIIYRLVGIEENLLTLTKMFFRKIKLGDDKTLKKRIFFIHPLYINKRRIKTFVKMSDEQLADLTNIDEKTIRQYKRNPLFMFYMLYRYKDFT